MSKRAYETPLDRVCDTADVEKNPEMAELHHSSYKVSLAVVRHHPFVHKTYSEGPVYYSSEESAALASNILICKRLCDDS